MLHRIFLETIISMILINENIAVLQYQHEETKRTIMRLEQAADACTQRTIAGQGAFAVLCGRYSKYFIKKPEVRQHHRTLSPLTPSHLQFEGIAFGVTEDLEFVGNYVINSNSPLPT